MGALCRGCRDSGGKGQHRKRDKGGGHGEGLGQEHRRQGRTNKGGHYTRCPDAQRVRHLRKSHSGRSVWGGSPRQREELNRRGSQKAREDPRLEWKRWRRSPGCSCHREGSFVVESRRGGGGKLCGTRQERDPPTQGGLTGWESLTSGGPPRRGRGRSGSGADTAASAAAAAPGFHWPPALP